MNRNAILLLLFPLQVLAIPINTTKFDLYPISISVIIIYIILTEKKIGINIVITLFTFVSVSVIISIFFHFAPLERFFSALFWLSFLISAWFLPDKLYTNNFYDVLLIIGKVLIIIIYFQNFYIGEERPKAFFIEPSTAGLIMYSYSIIYLIRILIFEKNKNLLTNSLHFISFFTAGYFTKSSHITLVFAIPLIFFVFILRKLKFRTIFLAVFIGTFLVFYFILNNDQIIDKLDFSSETKELNLSQLSWLRGLDQAIMSIKKSPFFGFGIGSTGGFEFSSDYDYGLYSAGFWDMNLKDGYSLLFRLIIEIGLIPTLIVSAMIIGNIKKISPYVNQKIDPENLKVISLFTFGLSIFIGSLIKEPSFACSPLFISIICMSFVNLLPKIKSRSSINNSLQRF